jgi:hypothetical protein
MRRIIYLILNLLFVFSSGLLANPEVQSIRALYNEADKSKTRSEIFLREAKFKVLEEPENNLYQAYYGAAKMIRAKFLINPFMKLKDFNEAKDLIEESVLSDNENLEIRYIRLGVQSHLPIFLNYRDNIPEDRDKISKALINKSIQDKALISDMTNLLKILQVETKPKTQN